MATVAEKMTAIGDAIRAKTGGTEKLTLDQMASEIAGIKSGGPNGTAWTNSVVPASKAYKICYANNTWILAGPEGLYHSTDGKRWSQRSIPVTVKGCFGLCYANSVWVAGSISNYGLLYSEDNGVTWKNTNVKAGCSCYSIHYANDLWAAACGKRGIWYSTDGKTWTQSNITSGVTGRCVYYANNLWICDKWYSTDGINWTKCTGINVGLFSAYYNNNIWTAIDTNGIIYYSTNGMEWTSTDVTNLLYGTIYYANNLWVAVGNGGFYYSSDGMAWSQANVTASSIRFVHYDNNIWIAAAATEDGLWCSRDGITWMRTIDNNSLSDEAACFANNMWVTGRYYSLA